MIWVEVQPLPGEQQNPAISQLPPGATAVSGMAGPVASVLKTAGDELQACIKKMADVITAAVAEGGPQSWTAEFAISFKGTAAIPVIASGEATANLKITLTWKRA